MMRYICETFLVGIYKWHILTPILTMHILNMSHFKQTWMMEIIFVIIMKSMQNTNLSCLHSVAIAADGYCRRLRRPPVRPSRTTLPLLPFNDISFRPEIWWCAAKWHTVGRFFKLAMLHRFLCILRNCVVFYGRLGGGMRDDVTALTYF